MAEIATVAFHFHWSQAEILDLEHAARRTFIDHIARLEARTG